MKTRPSPPPAPPRRAFVTGATGLLGSNLVRALVARGIGVRALARSRAKAEKQLSELTGVEIIEGDMTNVGSFAKALAQVDVVFHTAAHFRAAYQGGDHRERLHRVNVSGTRDLLHAAWDAGVRRFVHTSSIAVLNGPPGVLIDETMRRTPDEADDYYRSKIQSEHEVDKFLARRADMWACFVLPGWMHGPGDSGPTSAGQTVLDFVQRKLPGVPPGTFSIVDARDVAAALIAAAEHGRRGERYLAAGRHCDMAGLFAELERASGVPSPRRRIPLFALRLLGLMEESVARIARRPALLSLATVRLMARENDRSRFDHQKSFRELGLSFRPLADTLRDEIAWYRAQGWLPATAEKSG